MWNLDGFGSALRAGSTTGSVVCAPAQPPGRGPRVGGVPTELLTRWGRDLDPDHVLVEYPRPQLVRGSYLNLNGRWEHAFTGLDAPAPVRYDGPIVVPFSPEAPLSGVRRQLQPDELLWYRRTVVLPEDLGGGPDRRVLLHFGAVDQTCTVWVDDVEVGRHHGGYLPFFFDVTDALADVEGHSLVVRVRDVSDGRGPSSGKQRLQRGGIWYTAQSGIWQTVWMEAVPAGYVARLDLVPHLADGALEVTVHAGGSPTGPAEVRVLADGVEVAAAEAPAGEPVRIPVPDVRPWSPEDPFLYDVEVRLGVDRVESYVGMRSVGVGQDEDGLPRLLLNGEPYLHVGVLDQGYWSDGLLTAPSDAAMVHDIATMKSLGFTMLRKHIKIEPLRWYHHCDRLGMLVWQDLVNGGGRYPTATISWPGRRRGRRLRLRDDRYALFGRRDAHARHEFRREVARTVELLGSVPSLVAWVPFNEGWGQFDAVEVTAVLRALDPTRSIDHASGWHDQGAGDLWSHHVYVRAFRAPRRRRDEHRVLALTEYGGYDLRVPGHETSTEGFGYRHSRTPAELAEMFTRLHREELGPAVPLGLGATVYTQVSDVEDELNGLLTYDREVLKIEVPVVRAALDALRLRSRSGPT